MNAPLTLDQIRALRAAAVLGEPAENPRATRRRAVGRELKRSANDDDEYEPEMRKVRPVGNGSLSDGKTQNRTNSLDAPVPPFTVLLWNVENYGEHKARGNLIANPIIRYVLDELGVDVAIFLETQSAPTDAIAGIEFRLADVMRTAKEKKKGERTDIAFRLRWSDAELAELRDEHERSKKLYGALLDNPAFHAISSDVTGRQKSLPPKIGPCRSWPRGTPSAAKNADISRFKRIYSFDSQARPFPHWLLSAFNDLADVYDLRFVAEEPDDDEDGNPVWPEYDDDGLTRPLKPEEIARLRRSVRRLCFGGSDYGFWALKKERLEEITEAEIQEVLRVLRQHSTNMEGVEDELRRIADADRIDPDEFVLEDRKEARDLLAKLERMAVLTLKTSIDAAPPSVVVLPARDVIGYENDGNACYLLSVLQLLNRVPSAVFDAGVGRTAPVICDRTMPLLQAATTQAANATYATYSKDHPAQQVALERNFVKSLNSLLLRRALKVRCGWRSEYDSEDASEALVKILEAFGGGGFQFIAKTTRVLDHAHAVRTVGESIEAELAGGRVVLVTRDPMNILPLPVPEGTKTFTQAFAEAQRAPGGAAPIRYAYAGAAWSARVIEERTSFEQIPDHVLIRLNRISAGMVNGVFRRMKDGRPVVMPDTWEERHLLAFICHHGTSANGGHYTAYVRIGAQWYWVDDWRVTPVADVADARNNGFLYYYGPKAAARAEADSDDDLGLAPMDHSSGESQNEDADEHDATMGEVSASPSQSEDDDDEDKAIEELCPFLDEIFGWDPGEDSILGKGAALSDPKPVDAGRLQTVRDLLTGMIGVRNVETYVVMFRAAPERGKVDDAILAERHRNIGHYVYKAQLRSTDASGQELGYQDPAVWINGRCPFYFELDVWKRDGGKSVRLPILALHAPYGMPAAFKSKTTPKPKSKGVGLPPPLPSKHAPIDFDGDDDNPLKMRADAMSSLLQIGIPSYGADPIQAMAQFGDGLIAGDFNLDMCQCGTNPTIGAPYQAMANADFIATVNAVPTTLLPVEQKLPADANDVADEEGAWYGHAYDNIFVRSSELAVATTRMAVGRVPPGTRIGGAVDVFDFIERYAAANPSFLPIAEAVVRNPANYHKTRHTPATRARHEYDRWTNATNARQRAYFLYKRYISDHLPVFVDLDIHSKGSLPKSAPAADSSAPKVPRSVIGIRNLGNTCYLNAALQLLWAFGDTALWSATSQQVNVDLYAHVTTFIAVMTHDAETGSYVGDGTEFTRGNDTRLCETDQLTHDIRGQLNRSGLHGQSFRLNQQEDAAEALDIILSSCASQVDVHGAKLDLSPQALGNALWNNTLGDVRPSPCHFFVCKTLTFKLGAQTSLVDGIQLNAFNQADQIECHSILRLEISDATVHTLQDAFNAWTSMAVPNADETRVVVGLAGYLATRTRDDCRILDPLPQHLIVQLKRFNTVVTVTNGTATSTTTKIDTPVSVSAGLTVRGGVTYDVISCIQHRGLTARSGHYVAFHHRDGYWWEVNDSSVTVAPAGIDDGLSSGYIYLLKLRG